jgi:hypothetical protein
MADPLTATFACSLETPEWALINKNRAGLPGLAESICMSPFRQHQGKSSKHPNPVLVRRLTPRAVLDIADRLSAS